MYLNAKGNRIRDPEQLDRIRALVIPPAWTNVWISPLPQGHLQATGRDSRGASNTCITPAGARFAMPLNSIAC